MTDNPTDISKNKSTVSSMIDALRLEIRELQKFATVQEDLIVEGGSPSANIKVPKKLTAEQTIQFMKQFPNGFPLADENAFFGIARALTLESPELFDVDSFDAYEKKFGSTMEMQEKGASASKNIVAGKPTAAANEPVAVRTIMARQQSTKGGQATSLVDEAFDPREITLSQYIDLYIEKAGSAASWGNAIRNNKVLQPYLDKPVIDLFDVANESKSGNLLADAQNAVKSDSGKATLQSRIRTIENSGVFAKIDRIDAAEKSSLAADYVPLSDNVVKLATRGKRATNKIQFNASKIGHLVDNLVKHVQKFPEDRSIANVILMNLETGSRPSLMLGLLGTDVVPNQTDPSVQAMGYFGSNGLLIPPDRPGAKSSSERKKSDRPYSTPISKRASAILQDQSEYLRTVPWANQRISGLLFQIEGDDGPRKIELRDVNRVLEQVTPEGLVRENTDKGQVNSNKPLTAKDIRKLQIQAMNSVGIGRENQAMLLSRDVGGDVGAQNVYIGEAGNYNEPSVNDLNKASLYMWGQYSYRQPGGEKASKQNKFLSPSTFIFNPPPETPEYINFNEAVGNKDVPILREPYTTPFEDTTQGPTAGTTKSQPAPKDRPDAPDISEENRKWLESRGFKSLFTILAGAVGVETLRYAVTEPAAFARDMAIEGALLAAKAPAAVAAATSMALEPKKMGMSELTEEELEFTQRDPQPLADAEQEAMRDTGFVNIDRKPEAAPVNQEKGFATPPPRVDTTLDDLPPERQASYR